MSPELVAKLLIGTVVLAFLLTPIFVYRRINQIIKNLEDDIEKLSSGCQADLRANCLEEFLYKMTDKQLMITGALLFNLYMFIILVIFSTIPNNYEFFGYVFVGSILIMLIIGTGYFANFFWKHRESLVNKDYMGVLDTKRKIFLGAVIFSWVLGFISGL